MVDIRVQSLADALGAPVVTGAILIAQVFEGHSPATRVAGEDVTFPVVVRVNLTGAADEVFALYTLPPNLYWRIVITVPPYNVTRNVVLPAGAGPFDFADLVDVDPTTALPDPGSALADAFIAELEAIRDATIAIAVDDFSVSQQVESGPLTGAALAAQPVSTATQAALDLKQDESAMDASVAQQVESGPLTGAALDVTIPAVGGSAVFWSAEAGSLHTLLNIALANCATAGIPVLYLRGTTYDVSGGHILVPAGVELRGTIGTVLNGGAYSIVSDGTVSNLTLGTGWTYMGDLSSGYAGATGVGIVGGRVEGVRVARGGIQLWPSRRPHNLLPNVVSRLSTVSSNRPTRILIMGDSLATIGSGSGTHWIDLLFTSGAVGGADYYIGGLFGGANVAVTKLGISGTTANVDLPYVAREVQGLSIGEGLDGQALLNPGILSEANLIGSQDLVIINQGHNGAATEAIERIVAICRRMGVEVIVLTGNDSSSGALAFGKPLWLQHRIAAAYGAPVADSYGYMLREVLTGRASSWAALLADADHPNQLGWNQYAAAIRDLFLDQSETEPGSPRLPYKSVFRGNLSSETPLNWGSAQFMCSTPLELAGGAAMATPADTVRTPLAGRRASFTNTAVDIPNGGSATFAVVDASDVSIIFERLTGSGTAVISTDNGASVIGGSVTISSISGTPSQQVHSIASGTWGMGNTVGDWGKLPFLSRPLRIASTSGTIRVLAVVWSGYKSAPFVRDAITGQFAGVTESGTWDTEAGPWFGVPNVRSTDTDNSSITFEFEGTGFVIKLGRSQAAGRINLTVDGVLVQTNGGYWATATDTIYPVTKTDLAFGRHRVTLQLRDTHPSGVAPTPGARGGRKMSIYEIAALDSRMGV